MKMMAELRRWAQNREIAEMSKNTRIDKNMKLKTLVLAILVFMGLSLSSVGGAQTDINSLQNSNFNKQTITPRLIRKIDFSRYGSNVSVMQLAFSPDGHYLAIAVNPDLGHTDIVIWDMEKGQPQSHIHCPRPYGLAIGLQLFWSQDGRVISFGDKYQWDPISGEELPDNPVMGRSAKLNKDGTKILTIVGVLGAPSYIYVYDTATWAVRKIYLDGFSATTADWTSDDKIFVKAGLTHELYSQVIDGYQPRDFHDVAFRLLDPQGVSKTKTLWIPAQKTGNPQMPYEYSPDSSGVEAGDYFANKIIMKSGLMIDGKTLEIDRSTQDLLKNIFDESLGAVISRNGRWLITKGAPKHRGQSLVPNRIIDLSSKRVISEFGELVDYGAGFAFSDSKMSLAIGNNRMVQVYKFE